MKKKIVSILTIGLVIFSMSVSVLAHSGRTDSNGGHKDNKNKSGLGSYHYHCGGYPAHLHQNGVCPYNGNASSSSGSKSNSSSSNSSSSSSSKSNSSASSSSNASTSRAASVPRVPQIVYATKINVSNMPSAVQAGESVQLNASVYPSNAEDKDISWETSDSSVATIDQKGNLVAVSVGTAVISAKTSRGTTSKYNITVKEVAAEQIFIEGKQNEILIGDAGALSVVFVPDNTTYKDINWVSEDDSIVSVDEHGNFVALAVGKTTISAIHKNLTDSFEIEVKPILAKSIEISCVGTESDLESEKLRFQEGATVEFSAVVLPNNTTDATVKWSVDKADIAEIDENGKLKALAEGTVTIIAETSNGVKDMVEVEVYKASAIVTIIAVVILLLMAGGLIGGPILLVMWLKKKFKKQ